jgi:hypothetical protein
LIGIFIKHILQVHAMYAKTMMDLISPPVHTGAPPLLRCHTCIEQHRHVVYARAMNIIIIYRIIVLIHDLILL